MLSCRHYAELGLLHYSIQQCNHCAAVSERCGFAAERVDDPLDSAIH